LSKRRETPARRGAARAQRRWPVGALLVGGIVLAFLIIFVVVLVLDVRQQGGSTAPSGVTSYRNPSQTHTEAPVDYPQTPR